MSVLMVMSPSAAFPPLAVCMFAHVCFRACVGADIHIQPPFKLLRKKNPLYIRLVNSSANLQSCLAQGPPTWFQPIG